LGFGAERDRRVGWGFTELTPVARERIAAICLNERIFSLFRKSRDVAAKSGNQSRIEPVATKPKLVKWACGCDTIWRAYGRAPMQAICEICATKYHLAQPPMQEENRCQ
jgi:hypothetical protein